jgi:hypothetical protein
MLLSWLVNIGIIFALGDKYVLFMTGLERTHIKLAKSPYFITPKNTNIKGWVGGEKKRTHKCHKKPNKRDLVKGETTK